MTSKRKIGPFEVSPVGLGCMSLSHAYGTPPDPEHGRALLNRALDLGYDFLDTAALYGFGANEALLGEAIERTGHGFHHFGRASDDVDRDIAEMEARGYKLAFRAGVPTGGDVAYMDGGPQCPGFVELISATAGMEQAFTRFWQASVGWDGADPIRPFG